MKNDLSTDKLHQQQIKKAIELIRPYFDITSQALCRERVKVANNDLNHYERSLMVFIATKDIFKATEYFNSLEQNEITPDYLIVTIGSNFYSCSKSIKFVARATLKNLRKKKGKKK